VLDDYELRAKLLHEAHLVLWNLIGQPAPKSGMPDFDTADAA